jgi:hypothetical protein
MRSTLKRTVKILHPGYQKLVLEYKVNMIPRYGYGKPLHPMLLSIIENQDYNETLDRIVQNQDVFFAIHDSSMAVNDNDPVWNNDYLPGLDIMALYTIIDLYKPIRYVEIGSGNSTKVARKASNDRGGSTWILSVDPFPRTNIDHLADDVIRKPLEEIEDLSVIYNQLEANDILFVDNSHRCLPNSDATVVFLELLPRLKKGVIVQFHDIYLPWDYPTFMCDRFYSEQYVLAAMILANPFRYRPLFPAWYISQTPELNSQLDEVWNHPTLQLVERHGGSFWIQIGD